jgi:hypothetical protein
VYLTACTAGDLNRDALPDLACVAAEDDYGTGPLVLLRGNGNGTFGPPAATGGSGMDPQLADINRDGRSTWCWEGRGRSGSVTGRAA